MISAFEVYLVMQLDSIRTMLLVSGVIGTAFCFSAFVTVFEFEDTPRWLKFIFGLCILFGFASGLLPSSKTAAAMILVPALASEEVVEPVAAEARELYQLAKQALREVAKTEKEPQE